MTADNLERGRPAHDGGRTADDFGCIAFDVTSTSQAHAIPREYQGKVVDLLALVTGGADYAFSLRSGAAVAFGTTGTAAGTQTQIGGRLIENVRHRVTVPSGAPGETVYFVRDAAGTGMIRIELVTT